VQSRAHAIQYWRSFDALEQYGAEHDSQHWPAWAAFNKRMGRSAATSASGTRRIASAPHYRRSTADAAPWPSARSVASFPRAIGSRARAGRWRVRVAIQ